MAQANKSEPVSAPAAASKPTKPVQKKRKKNAPDRPQPEWMFPPDEENPILNPKPKSEQQIRKDQEDRDEAIKFLHYKSVTAPMKPAPPGMLLTLVGAFLTSYGFNSASRLYTSQCKSRKKLAAWDHELGAKLPKGFPDLVKIYRDWHKEYQQNVESEAPSSTSEEEDSDIPEDREVKGSKKLKQEETSSSGSSDGSDSEGEAKKIKSTAKPTKKPKKASKSSGSSSNSTSESDADDEKEASGGKVNSLPKPTVNGLIQNMKRKAGPDDSSSSGSSSSSSSSEDEKPRPSKKSKTDSVKRTDSTKDIKKGEKSEDATARLPTKGLTNKTVAQSSSSESSSSSDSDERAPIKNPLPKPISGDTSSSSESDTAAGSKIATFSKPGDISIPTKVSSDSAKSTDSSATLDVTPTNKPSTSDTRSSSSPSTSSSSSSSSPSSSLPVPPAEIAPKPVKSEPVATPKRKRSLSPHSTRKAMTPAKVAKKENTPFQRVAKDTQVDPKLASNAYVSYDYADRAHKDLSVTKGKNFTKEKNKKKRGSYRGGVIDVDGRKGIKFED